MSVTVSAPEYINVIPQIPHVRVESERTRALSEIEWQVAHYEAGGTIPETWTPAQELAHLIEVALFHQHRDFGGGVLGRTLEYTYALFPSGRIYRVNRETLVTWSHRNGNRVGMSTLFVLGVGQEPTAAMKATARQHFDYTISRSDMRVIRPRTVGHGETNLIYGGGPDWGNNTRCPAKALPFVRAYREEQPMPDPNPNPTPDSRFFTETGHNLSRGFKVYWEQNGGLKEFGFPLTEEESGSGFPYNLLPELAGYTVQRFERGLLHWKDGEPVGSGRLGALVEGLLAHGHFEAAGPLSCACEATA